MFRTLLISMFLTSTALADIWTVDDDGKADFDNIQAAVDASSDGDEIVVMPGTYTSTQDGHVVNMLGKAVTLRSSDPSDPDVVAATIIDGENTRRGLACFNEETSQTIISGFTVTNGYAVGYDYDNDGVIYPSIEESGGGMFILNSHPSISYSAFASNFVSDNPDPKINSGSGGGMFVKDSNPYLQNCEFTGNVVEDGFGGGLSAWGNEQITIENCTFTDNVISYGGGGGISGNNLLMTNCEFNHNVIKTAILGRGGWGGGAHIRESTFIGCNFINNSAADDGGGISIYDGSSGGSTLDDCNFINNTARKGGGMSYSGHSIEVENCTFMNNICTNWWMGAIYIENAGGIIFSGCTISENDACGISNVDTSAELILTDTIVCDNSPYQIVGSWQDGGGACVAVSCLDDDDDGFPDECDGFGDGQHYVPTEYPTIQDAIDVAGTGDEIIVLPGVYTGEGDSVIDTLGKQIWIHSTDGPAVTIIDGEEERNGIVSWGGDTNATIIEGFTVTRGVTAVSCWHTSPTLTNLIINSGSTSNYAFWSYGGRPKLSDCNFSDCSSTYVMYCEDSDIELTNCIFENNNGVVYSSCMHCRGGSPILNNCTFINNNSAIYAEGNGDTFSISNSVFANNGKAWVGLPTAIVMNEVNPIIENCSFTNNAGNGGGAITFDTTFWMPGMSLIAKFADCTFEGNESSGYSGGGGLLITGMSLGGLTIEIENCTFKNNFAHAEGGGLRCGSQAPVSIVGCTFEGNETNYNGGGVFCNDGTTITDTLVCGNSPDQIVGDYIDGGGNTIADECPIDCPDINGDGYVNVSDLLAVINAWGIDCDGCSEDVNNDANVDVTDLLMVIGNWGECE